MIFFVTCLKKKKKMFKRNLLILENFFHHLIYEANYITILDAIIED